LLKRHRRVCSPMQNHKPSTNQSSRSRSRSSSRASLSKGKVATALVLACPGVKKDGRTDLAGVPDDYARISRFLHEKGVRVDGQSSCDAAMTSNDVKRKLHLFINNGCRFADWCLLFLYGHGQRGTGDWQLHDRSLSFSEFIELRNEIAARYDKTVPIFILVDFCFSGHWVDQARELNTKDVAIQSACSAFVKTPDAFDRTFSFWWLYVQNGGQRVQDLPLIDWYQPSMFLSEGLEEPRFGQWILQWVALPPQVPHVAKQSDLDFMGREEELLYLQFWDYLDMSQLDDATELLSDRCFKLLSHPVQNLFRLHLEYQQCFSCHSRIAGKKARSEVLQNLQEGLENIAHYGSVENVSVKIKYLDVSMSLYRLLAAESRLASDTAGAINFVELALDVAQQGLELLDSCLVNPLFSSRVHLEMQYLTAEAWELGIISRVRERFSGFLHCMAAADRTCDREFLVHCSESNLELSLRRRMGAGVMRRTHNIVMLRASMLADVYPDAERLTALFQAVKQVPDVDLLQVSSCMKGAAVRKVMARIQELGGFIEAGFSPMTGHKVIVPEKQQRMGHLWVNATPA